MKKWLNSVVVLLAIAILSGNSQAQSIQDKIQQFGQDYAKGYVGPFGEAFGAALNSGWYSTANVSDGIDIFIGVKVMLMPIPDAGKMFSLQSPWQGGGVDVVPTVFGPKTNVPISGNNPGLGPSSYPQGTDQNYSAMAVPHISVGNIFGTRLMLRWLPPIPVQNYGNISMFGIGAQHSLNRYIPLIPLDLAAMVAYQKFSLGDLISANSFTLGVQASKRFAIVTLYGGLAYESSKFSFSYLATFIDPANQTQTISQQIGFDISGKNTVRATIGFALSLAVVKINADYSIASQPVATLGVGFGI